MLNVLYKVQARIMGVSLTLFLFVFATYQCASAAAAVKTYGYFSAIYEDTGKMPDDSNDPGEFGIPHLNLMFQSTISNDFRTYLNLFADGAEAVEIRNVWGEYTYRDYLKFRVGKLYRPFDLFNEKLDALPTHNCIEPPELFDKDHLMIPRVGDFMVHGTHPLAGHLMKYSFTTGNNEVVSSSKPVSWDLNYNPGNILIGTSGYYANEKAGSPVALGDGAPTGGILPWMKSDKYMVLGGYVQAKWENLLVQAAYWTADHKAIRDTALVRTLSTSTYLNADQQKRFGLNSAVLNENGDHTID
ncbi:MAG: hypothetical protein OEM52_02235, partial [bacterium]|nr:hypothetical protein [bacterium]